MKKSIGIITVFVLAVLVLVMPEQVTAAPVGEWYLQDDEITFDEGWKAEAFSAQEKRCDLFWWNNDHGIEPWLRIDPFNRPGWRWSMLTFYRHWFESQGSRDGANEPDATGPTTQAPVPASLYLFSSALIGLYSIEKKIKKKRNQKCG